jgi:hypothetical protein
MLPFDGLDITVWDIEKMLVEFLQGSETWDVGDQCVKRIDPIAGENPERKNPDAVYLRCTLGHQNFTHFVARGQFRIVDAPPHESHEADYKGGL